MIDGIGPASLGGCVSDEPELRWQMATPRSSRCRILDDFVCHQCRPQTPVGLPVVAGDMTVRSSARISDLWVDVPEQLVRYLRDTNWKAKAAPAWPRCSMVRVKSDRKVAGACRSMAKHFENMCRATAVGPFRSRKLEEEKICAYYGGGYLYAAQSRQDPQI